MPSRGGGFRGSAAANAGTGAGRPARPEGGRKRSGGCRRTCAIGAEGMDKAPCCDDISRAGLSRGLPLRCRFGAVAVRRCGSRMHMPVRDVRRQLGGRHPECRECAAWAVCVQMLYSVSADCCQLPRAAGCCFGQPHLIDRHSRTGLATRSVARCPRHQASFLLLQPPPPRAHHGRGYVCASAPFRSDRVPPRPLGRFRGARGIGFAAPASSKCSALIRVAPPHARFFDAPVTLICPPIASAPSDDPTFLPRPPAAPFPRLPQPRELFPPLR